MALNSVTGGSLESKNKLLIKIYEDGIQASNLSKAGFKSS